MAVLPNLSQMTDSVMSNLSPDQKSFNKELDAFKARIAEQDKIIAALKSQSDRKITCKVTEKGGVSVYGLGRFPVTLYGSQWDKLAANMPAIMAFVDANRSLLSTKD